MSTWWETVTDGRFATDPAGAAAVPAVAGGGDLVFVQATTQGSAGISCYLIIGGWCS